MRGVRPYLDAVRWPRLISQEEPGVRGLPIPIDGLGGDVQDIGCFVHGQAAKESQLDNLAHASIERRQSAERIVERNEVVLLQGWQLVDVIETDVNRTAATFLALPAACRLHQDPSHHLRRQSEEVRAIPPFDAIDVDQPQVRLVHQRRRLQRMIRPLLAHIAPGETVELVVDQRHQSREGRSVALAPRSEELGGFAVGIRRHDSFSGRMAPLLTGDGMVHRGDAAPDPASRSPT